MDFILFYGLMGLALIITLGAQAYVSGSYRKYSKIMTRNKITGEEAARRVLDKNGLQNVSIELSQGALSDHYDPKSKTIRLSEKVYRESSIASIAVAVHECGHAIQDKEGYAYMKFRSAIFPLVRFSSFAGYIVILIGVIANITQLMWIGIILELVILAFQLLTLPVEFNSSNRAIKEIEETGLLDKDEIKGGRKMLRAAATTYVASVATALIEIARLLLMVMSNSRD